MMKGGGDGDVSACLNCPRECHIGLQPSKVTHKLYKSFQTISLHYFSKRGKAAVMIAEERGDMVIPRRGCGMLRRIGVACGALLSPGAMSDVEDTSYSDTTAF